MNDPIQDKIEGDLAALKRGLELFLSGQDFWTLFRPPEPRIRRTPDNKGGRAEYHYTVLRQRDGYCLQGWVSAALEQDVIVNSAILKLREGIDEARGKVWLTVEVEAVAGRSVVGKGRPFFLSPLSVREAERATILGKPGCTVGVTTQVKHVTVTELGKLESIDHDRPPNGALWISGLTGFSRGQVVSVRFEGLVADPALLEGSST